MGEITGNHNEYINGIDVKGDKVQDGIQEDLIKEKARKYVENKIQSGISKEELDQLLKEIKKLLERQDIERLNLKEELEKQKGNVVGEIKNNVENEKKTQIVQNMIYKELGINGSLENNTNSMQFIKGVVDGLILDNIKLVEELISKGIEELVTMLKNLIDPQVILEIIKDLISSLGDILETFQKPYEGGVAIGGMGLGILGKSMKGLKIANKVGDKAIDFNKVDILDLKGKYGLDSIKGLKPIEAKKRIEEFSNSIDIKYLVNHPQRIDNTLDILESMCDYITKNSGDILKLSPKDLNDFRYVFGELRKNVDDLGKDNSLGRRRIDFIELRNGKMRDTITILNPNLLPKN